MKIINSLNNSYVLELCKLKNRKNRFEKQLFIVEGYHLVQEALKTDHVKAVISTDEQLLKGILNVDTYLVTDAIIKKISTTISPQNIIAVVRMNTLEFTKETFKNKKQLKLVVLDDVNDPGNLGTIIRTAASLGYDAVISSPNSVDYYNEKTLRASQGAIFKIPLYRNNLGNILNELKKQNVVLLATSLTNSVPLPLNDTSKRFALIFGNEANGVSEEVINISDQRIRIPMANDVESLNVSVAAGIIMWIFK